MASKLAEAQPPALAQGGEDLADALLVGIHRNVDIAQPVVTRSGNPRVTLGPLARGKLPVRRRRVRPPVHRRYRWSAPGLPAPVAVDADSFSPSS